MEIQKSMIYSIIASIVVSGVFLFFFPFEENAEKELGTFILYGQTAQKIEQIEGVDTWTAPQDVYIIGSLVTVYINDPEPYQGNTVLSDISLNPLMSINRKDYYKSNFSGVVNHVYFEESVNNPQTLKESTEMGTNKLLSEESIENRYLGTTYTNGKSNLAMFNKNTYIKVKAGEKVYLHLWNGDGRLNKSAGANAIVYYIKA